MNSKGTEQKAKRDAEMRKNWFDKNEMHLYEAVLDNVRIDVVGRDVQDAEVALRKWLDKATNNYELKKFYLAKDDAWE